MANALEENPFIFPLGKQASCLAPCLANEESERNRWIAGTDSVRGQNEIIAIEFDEEMYHLTSSRWSFDHQVKKVAWLVKDLIAVSSSDSSAVYQLPDLDNDILPNNVNGKTRKVVDLIQKKCVSLLSDQKSQIVVSVALDALAVYDLKKQSLKKSFEFNDKKITCSALNPAASDTEVLMGEKSGAISCFDMRNQKVSCSFNAHSIHVTDVDYNQNKPNVVLSSGKDCQIRIWDLRNPGVPLKEFKNHTHWVLNVKFNPFHDQLILSTSSDCRVNLYNMVSVSSSQFKRDEKELLEELHGMGSSPLEEDLVIKTTDELVFTYDQHGETVYTAAWSLNDPWIFASLSFDGNIVVNCVPSEYKYKIIFALSYLIDALSPSSCNKSRLADMTLYPVKSCGGFRPESWDVDEKGLVLDRHWMVVDENGNFVGQHEFPHMALIRPVSINPKDGIVEMNAPNCPENIILNISSKDSVMSVALFGENVNAHIVGLKEDEWFSRALGAPCHLVAYLDVRSAIPDTFKGSVSFSSESQFLCLFNTSFHHLKEMILKERGKMIDIESFRGNLTIDGMDIAPFEEQEWIGKSLKIGDQTFHVANGCDRCKMINVNQRTGKKSGEPFMTLSKLYKGEPKTPFGIFLMHDPELSVKPYKLKVGDQFQLL